MRWQDLEVLEEIGLTGYERKAFATLMAQGVADAEALCREGEIPSSKIYQAMEKLGTLGLAESNRRDRSSTPRSRAMTS